MSISDSVIRKLCKLVAQKGLRVRRENLARGAGFKVQSGDCIFSGERLVFLDKRLQPAQQMSILVDYIRENGLQFANEEIDFLPKSQRLLLLQA